MLRLRQRKIEFFEKPVTNDEKEIVALLKQVVEAVNEHNVDKFITIFSDSARIVVSGVMQEELNKSECLLYMTKAMLRIRHLSYSRTIVRIKNMEANISCISHIMFNDGNTNLASRYFKCKKEQDTWYFTEAGFF